MISGRLTDDLINHTLSGAYAAYSYFICGPPPFMEAMQKSLYAHGVSRKNIRTEVFGQASQKLSRGLSWPARIYGASAAAALLLPGIVLANDIYNPITATQKKAKEAAQTAEDNKTVTQRETDLGDMLGDLGSPSDTATATSDTTPNDSMDMNDMNSPTSGTSTPNTAPTPGATKKAPVLTLSTSATSLIAGGSVQLSWQAIDTADGKCSASGGWGGAKNASGQATVSPVVTTTYTMTCSNEVGSTTKSVTITVTSAPIAPMVTLSASATDIAAGASTTLTWNSTGTAPLMCTATGGWTGSKAAGGSQTVSPTVTTTYTLACTNSAGTSSKSVTVTVGTPATVSLSAGQTTITDGSSTTINWNAAGTGPITCTASGGWSGSRTASGSQTVSPTTDTTYTMKCSNAYGTQTKSITIYVQPATTGS